LSHQQIIVRHPEITRREQVRAIAITGERARLAHQPVDDVPIVDVMLVAPTQPRQSFHHLLRVPHFQVFDVHTNFHRFTDQSARHRVNVSIEVNQAAAVHTRWHPLARFQSPRWQRTQLRQLLRQTLPSSRI